LHHHGSIDLYNALKSFGTSPNFLITLASLKSPVAGSPVRLIVQTKAKQFAADPAAQPGIIKKFESGVPAREPRSLPDIVNAGWAFFQAKAPTFDGTDRGLIEWVSELVLKSIEVLEYRSRIGHA
jgi:hypothetical protein